MAYDAYRTAPDESHLDEYHDPRMQYTAAYIHAAQNEAYKSHSRQSSRERGDAAVPDQIRQPHPQQPIGDAVSSAFDKADPSNPLHPDLLAQITENVIKQLRTSTMDINTPVQSLHSQYPPPPPPPPPSQPVPHSPSTQSAASPPMPTRNVYTPPSPHKHSDHPIYGTPDPRPPSPREPSTSIFEDRRPPSRLSQSSDHSNARPKGPVRLCTAQEVTTLEKIWGQLFYENGEPTERLGQFLRGLAVHLIECYEPKNSLVVTPVKMVKYYEDTKLSNELYPWSDVFDDEHSSISRMYRDLMCQHHLVQERYDQRPDIPGLTPIGFEKWATQLIRAHPNEEFQRLQKTVLEMPISNPDDKKERFPKELSRRLFPDSVHPEIRASLQKTIAEHAGVKLPQQANVDATKTHLAEQPPRRPENGTDSEPAYVPSDVEREYGYLPNPSIERERKPYSNIPSDSAIDDTNPPPSQPQPIERQRKPYRVPGGGGGKLYEEDGKTSIPSQAQRSNSTTERMRAMSKPTGDVPKPEISHHHRGSMSQRRRQSPAGNDFRRSDGDLRPFQSSTHRQPTLPIGESYEDDGQRHAREADIRRAEYARRQADEDAASYGGSPSSRARYDPRFDGSDPRRGMQVNDEDYYRGGRQQGTGYDYSLPYGGSNYR